MSTNMTKALKRLGYAMTGQVPTGNSETKVVDEIANNFAFPFTKGAAVPDASSSPTKAEFNALLKSLRDAGIIETSSSSS